MKKSINEAIKASITKQVPSPEQKKAGEEEMTAPHHEIAKDILSAINSKDHVMLSEALKAAFEHHSGTDPYKE